MEGSRSNPWLWVMLLILLVVGAVAVVAAVVTPYGTGYGMMGVGYRMMGAGWGWGWGIAMMLVSLAVLVLLVLLIVEALTPRHGTLGYFTPAPPPVPASSALEILNARYARGEISRDEYLRIRGDVDGRTP